MLRYRHEFNCRVDNINNRLTTGFDPFPEVKRPVLLGKRVLKPDIETQATIGYKAPTDLVYST